MNHSRVRIFDTTLRDGEQAPGCHLGPADKLVVARQLQRLGVDIIEAGFPTSSPAEFEAVQTIAREVGTSANAPEIAALSRCVISEIDTTWEALRSAKNPRIHIFLATSDLHLEHKLHMTRAQVLTRAVEAVRHARQYTPNVQFSCEDASRTDRGYLAEVVSAVVEAGASTVNIPDTVGYAVPEEFAGLIRELYAKAPALKKVTVSVHCHDDLGMAVANSLAGLSGGARQVECTINGIGERAGNCALEEVVMALKTRADVLGMEVGVDPREIGPTSRMIIERMQMPVAANKAVVGAHAFAHASGVHQHGILQNKLTYEILQAEALGIQRPILPLTARSGRAALHERLKQVGYVISDEAMAGVYQRFKAFADTTRFVTDADLARLV